MMVNCAISDLRVVWKAGRLFCHNPVCFHRADSLPDLYFTAKAQVLPAEFYRGTATFLQGFLQGSLPTAAP